MFPGRGGQCRAPAEQVADAAIGKTLPGVEPAFRRRPAQHARDFPVGTQVRHEFFAQALGIGVLGQAQPPQQVARLERGQHGLENVRGRRWLHREFSASPVVQGKKPLLTHQHPLVDHVSNRTDALQLHGIGNSFSQCQAERIHGLDIQQCQHQHSRFIAIRARQIKPCHRPAHLRHRAQRPALDGQPVGQLPTVDELLTGLVTCPIGQIARIGFRQPQRHQRLEQRLRRFWQACQPSEQQVA